MVILIPEEVVSDLEVTAKALLMLETSRTRYGKDFVLKDQHGKRIPYKTAMREALYDLRTAMERYYAYRTQSPIRN